MLRYTPVAPGRPVIDGVTVADGSAEVAFTPGATGFPTTVSYTLTATPAAGGASFAVSGSGSPITVTGLTNGTAYRFTVTASNGTGSTASEPSSATVGVAPLISGTPLAGTVGTSYAYSFALDGLPVPTTTVTAGSLPAGLKLSADGKLSGTPSATGSSSFSVTVTNALGTNSTAVTLTVAAKAAPRADLALAAAAAVDPGSKDITYTLTVSNKGPATAGKVATVAVLPTGVLVRSATGSPTRNGRILIWRTGTVDVGASVRHPVTVQPTRSGTRTITAVTGSLQVPDPNLTNNAVALTGPESGPAGW